MAVSSAVLSMVRVLTIMHIVVGALLIIFGIADGGTAFLGREICLQLVTGSMGLDWCMGKCSLSKSAFVRYKLTYFSPPQLLARRGKKRRENKSKLQ